MKIVQFLRDLFGSKEIVKTTDTFEDTIIKIACEKFAIHAAANLISGCIAKCEFKTFMQNKEFKGDQYYIWNIEPNKNQNSTEFLQKLVSKLLTENEVLVVEAANQYLIADSFYHDEYAVKEDIFKDVVVKDFSFSRTFFASDVLYFKNNNENITQLLHNFNNGYNYLLNLAVGKYKRSGGRKGIANLDKIPSGDEKLKKQIDRMFDKDFAKYFEAENAVLPIPRGVTYVEQNGEGNKKSTSEMVDIRNILDEIFTRVAQAYRIPPALLKGEIGDIEQVTDNLLTFCIDPLVDLIQTEINRKLYGREYYLKGSMLKIDTTSIKHIDIFTVADKIDKLISDGIYSIDEIREKINDSVIGEEYSKIHYITKNYTKIKNLDSEKGGDE